MRWPPGARWVAVSAIVAGFVALVAGGAGARAHDTTTVEYSDPAWSPDGRRIAFVATTVTFDPKTSIERRTATLDVANADGSSIHVVTTVRADWLAWPTWSPDGTQIAFGRDQLFVVRTDRTHLRKLTIGCCPAWGPGGRKIAFSGSPESQAEVSVIDPDGRHERVVASPERDHSLWAPTWSPRGAKLAFLDDEAPDISANVPTWLAAIDRFGGKVRHLEGGYFAAPAWSPDGRKIAADGIRVLDLRTAKTTMLVNGTHPSWSPDSRRIAFAQKNKLYAMNADGSNVRQLVP